MVSDSEQTGKVKKKNINNSTVYIFSEKCVFGQFLFKCY